MTLAISFLVLFRRAGELWVLEDGHCYSRADGDLVICFMMGRCHFSSFRTPHEGYYVDCPLHGEPYVQEDFTGDSAVWLMFILDSFKGVEQGVGIDRVGLL